MVCYALSAAGNKIEPGEVGEEDTGLIQILQGLWAREWVLDLVSVYGRA